MMLIPTIVLCVLFVTLASIHVYWAFGGRWGWDSAIPTRDGEPLFEPGRFQTLLARRLYRSRSIVDTAKWYVGDYCDFYITGNR